MEVPSGALATERLAERGARDGTRPTRRRLRQRDWRRASWVPQAIRAAPQPREPNVSSDRGQAGGRSAGWLQDDSIDFSQSRGAGLFWIRPVLAAASREVSASAILPWLRWDRWIRGRPNRWACGSQQGQGPRRREGRSPSSREAPSQRQVFEPRWERSPTDEGQPFSSTAGACRIVVEHAAQRSGGQARYRSRQDCDSSCLR